jgi:hypothetical protein
MPTIAPATTRCESTHATATLGSAASVSVADRPKRRAERAEVELREWMSMPEVIGVEAVEIEVVREEARGKWRPREHADSLSLGERQDVALVLAVEQAVLVLQPCDRADCECALDRVGRVIRDPAVPHLPFLDQRLQLAP